MDQNSVSKLQLVHRAAGFTLIELLVVIAIIGILSAIGLVSLNGAREKARDAARKSDMAQIRTALVLYYDDHSFKYPTSTLTGATGTPDNFATALNSDIVGANGTYLDRAPTSPTPGAACATANAYYYVSDGTAGTTNDNATKFGLVTRLEAPGCADLYILNSTGFGGTKTTNTVVTSVHCGATYDVCATTPA